jgi:polar amino acid transport system substrate-binding protein
VLRVGINLGNALLAGRDPASGEPHGLAVDLARELGRRLRTDIELVTFESAGRMAEAAGTWDAAFLAADPAREGEIQFTAPYLEIDATYLVAAASPLRHLADVDREGIRIALSDKSAYDLALRRSINHAELVRAASVDDSVDLFFRDHLDALAGLRPLLLDVTRAHPGCRVLDGRFTAVRQAMGAPKGHEIALLEDFVREAKASCLIADLIDKHRLDGVTRLP